MSLRSLSYPKWIAASALVAGAAILGSCRDEKLPQASPRSASPSDPRAALIARGRVVYQSTCIACHNSDPKKAGSLGPDIWGASKELIQARVLNGAYPPGYTPKRGTHVMQPLPQVEKDLPAIHAYLNSEQN